MLRGALSSITNATVLYDNHTALLSFPESASLQVGGVAANVEEAAMESDPTSNTSWNSKIWNGYVSTLGFSVWTVGVVFCEYCNLVNTVLFIILLF